MNEKEAYTAALGELNRFVNYERSGDYPAGAEGLATDRIERLLAALGNPETRFAALHIAGTKGKGSTAHLTAALLRARGWRVGLYTSPHIICLRERIQIDGQFIAIGDFARAFSKVQAAAQTLPGRPTYFEMLTAVAFTAFADSLIDVAVIEVGLGGRLDATNVATLPVIASCVTAVSLDHTQILGATLEEIAREKAGILRRNIPAVIARQAPAAREVICLRARELDCPVVEIGRDITVKKCVSASDASRPLFDLRLEPGIFKQIEARNYEKLPLNLLGAHQWENAAAAFALANFICTAHAAGCVTREDAVRAWKNIRLPGRLETAGTAPAVILDGAHNPASAWVLTETLREYFPAAASPRIAVISISRDKNINEFLRILLPFFTGAVFTGNNSGRGAAPEELQAAASGLFPARTGDWEVVPDASAALARARILAGMHGLVCVTGSFYLVGDVRAECLHIPKEE